MPATAAVPVEANKGGTPAVDVGRYYRARLRADLRNHQIEEAYKNGVVLKASAFLFLIDGTVETVAVYGRLSLISGNDTGGQYYKVTREKVVNNRTGEIITVPESEWGHFDEILWRVANLNLQDRAYNRMQRLSADILNNEYTGSKRDKSLARKKDSIELAGLVRAFDYTIRAGHSLPKQWASFEAHLTSSRFTAMKEAVKQAADAVKTLPGTFWAGVYDKLRRSIGAPIVRENIDPDEMDQEDDPAYEDNDDGDTNTD